MASITRKTLLALVLLAVVAVAAVAGFIWSGFYNVAADDPHTAPVHRLLETIRERSIHARARRLEVPADLMDRERIVQGSGNYDAMCMGCHLAPGMAGTELSRGLYPAPPDLSRTTVDAAEAFWVIKHGIKASGMPAWGPSMDDEYIWNMVAFLQELPRLDAAQYQAMVASSGGHDHGGGETGPHDHAPHPHGAGDAHDDMDTGAADGGSHPHPPGTPADHHAPRPATTGAAPRPSTGTRASAASAQSGDTPPTAPAAAPEPPPREAHHDGHDHDH